MTLQISLSFIIDVLLKQYWPLDSTGFSIGLEMSLKAFKRGLNIAIIPVSWTQRKAGVSKLKLSENFKLYMSTLQKITG
jgi:hypothetical protein